LAQKASQKREGEGTTKANDVSESDVDNKTQVSTPKNDTVTSSGADTKSHK
jgi:hypothetical protein